MYEYQKTGNGVVVSFDGNEIFNQTSYQEGDPSIVILDADKQGIAYALIEIHSGDVVANLTISEII